MAGKEEVSKGKYESRGSLESGTTGDLSQAHNMGNTQGMSLHRTLRGCDPARITGVRWDSLPDCCAAMDPQRLFRKDRLEGEEEEVVLFAKECLQHRELGLGIEDEPGGSLWVRVRNRPEDRTSMKPSSYRWKKGHNCRP